MPFYLTRFSYTPATWAKLIKNPEDRRKAAKEYIESVGGKMHGFWYAFGDHDAYNLWEAPDNVSMAATAIAISAGGALSSLQTTVLLDRGAAKGLLDRLSAAGGKGLAERWTHGHSKMRDAGEAARARSRSEGVSQNPRKGRVY
jgi:uncharacterized protein with GYD domain